MAHSFVEVHDSERLAFEHFARARPQEPVLLIDTYDTERAAKRVADLANEEIFEFICTENNRDVQHLVGK